MPETFGSSVSQNIESKKRGKLLTFWLVLMLIINAGTAFTYKEKLKIVSGVAPRLR